jgi:hypothetical protein
MSRLVERSRGLAWPLLVAAGAALPLVAVLGSGHTLVWRDTAQLYAPHRVAGVDALRALRLPTWNPWEATGQPLLAQGLDFVLHPISLVLAPITASMDAVVVVAVVLAALGTWLAARVLGASHPGAAAAAFAYALSGYVLAMAANAIFLLGCASGPWVVAGWVLAARGGRGWLAAALAVGSLALSGDVGGLVAFNVIGAALGWQTGGARGLVRGALGAALGVGLAGVQLVPSWAYLAETARGAGLLDPSSVRHWALAPVRLVELVAPGFFVGIPRSYVAPVYAALGGGTDRFPFASSVFIGAPPILLALFAARRVPAARWLLGLAAVFLWLALGHHAYSQQLLSGVPVWGVLRYWEKMVGPLTLCLALGAGLGVDSLRGEVAGMAGRVAGLVAGGLAVAAAAVAALPADRLGLEDGVAALARARLELGLAHAAVALAMLAGVILARRRWPLAAPAAVAGVVWLQSVAASPFALHAGNPAALETRPPSLDAEGPGPRMVSPIGFDFVEGEGELDAIDLLQYWEGRSGRPSTNVAVRVDSIATYTGLTSIRWEMIIGAGELFWPLARRFGMTHVVSRPPASGPEGDTLRAATAGATGIASHDVGRLLVWTVPHRPWASFAPSVRIAPDRDTAAALLGEELVSGRPTVVLEASHALPVSPGRVLSVERAAQVIAVEAESVANAVLVVGDAFAPGWRAWIDGQPEEILPADVLVRAVAWPAGRHRLVMRYVPPGLGVGLVVSALALVVAAALGLLGRHASGRQGVAGGSEARSRRTRSSTLGTSSG